LDKKQHPTREDLVKALSLFEAVADIPTKFALLWASLALACSPAFAGDPNAGGTNFNSITRPAVELIGPLANTTAAAARVIVPDGTSLFQPIAPAETRWFAFEAEPGKTYVVDILDPYGDLGTNVIGAVAVTDSGGVSAPPEANSNCSAVATNRAPGLEVNTDGWRCIIRTFTPTNGATQNKRGIYVSIGSGGGTSFQIRVRESTIYGRWTTNGYDFHVELQNTTADSTCVQIVLNPGTGYVYSGGAWSVAGAIVSTQVPVPPMGAIKTVFANGTLSGGDNKGTMRLTDCGTGELVPNGIQVSSFGFNPVTNVFYYTTPTRANQGGQNTW
jgi:hypothetical protein